MLKKYSCKTMLSVNTKLVKMHILKKLDGAKRTHMAYWFNVK